MATLAAAIPATVLAAIYAIPGARYALDPIMKSSRERGRWVRVAKLAELPTDDALSFAITGESRDAWTRSDAQRLGTVWLRKKTDTTVLALSAECPHLGCSVKHAAEAKQFACPCHKSGFSLDGAVLYGPSPRGMDALETRITGDDVEVRFTRFRTQTHDRIELACAAAQAVEGETDATRS